jgi:hypothetical protein
MAEDIQQEYPTTPGQDYLDYAIVGLLGFFTLAIIYESIRRKRVGIGGRKLYRMTGHDPIPKKRKSCSLCSELKKLR